MDKKLTTFFLITALVLPVVVFAQIANIDKPPQGVIIVPLVILSDVLKFLWPIFIGAAIIMLLFAGLMFVIANGDPTKIATAKKAVIWAVIGIVVAILAFSAYYIIRDIVAPVPTTMPPGGII